MMLNSKIFIVAILVAGVNTQRYLNFNCNHYGPYTIDICYKVYVTNGFFECDYVNDTSVVTGNYYRDNTSCNMDVSPYMTSVFTQNDFNDSSDINKVQCDQSAPCGYAILYSYSDGECAGDNYASLPAIMDQCLVDGNESKIFSCSGSIINTTFYNKSIDCTGTSYTVVDDYSTWGSKTNCWQVRA